jgi:serine/threonine protein kinase
MNYEKCIKHEGYIPGKIIKKTENNIVMIVFKNKKKYIAKILNILKTIDRLEILNMNTEIEALKYFSYKLVLPFFPKYINDFTCNKNKIVIMSYIEGKTLIEYDNIKMSYDWWKSLLYQLILIIYILEDNKILHNDFWDANIILEPHDEDISIKYKNKTYDVPKFDFMIKVLDFQYTNQYTSNPKIYSPYVMSKFKKYQKEKKILGWSNVFHVGGDLNQILGILLNYKYVPKNIEKSIRNIVVKNKGTKFPYAIQKTNSKTSGKYLLKNFNKLFT